MAYRSKYEGRDVKDLAGVTVTIRSTGNRAIRLPTDDTRYEEPVTIHFGEGTEVIGTPRVTETVPDGLDASLEVIDSATVKLNPMLLNPDESISIFTLLTNVQDEVKVNGHIEDAPPIKEIQPSSRMRGREIFFGMLLFIPGGLALIGVGAIVGWLFFDSASTGVGLVLAAGTVLFGVYLLLSLLVGLTRWLRDKWQQRSPGA